ncbi:MAG: DUF1810 domain-containing protein [Halioglobus sp.]
MLDELETLNRFVNAQNPVYQRVVQELKHGHKETHWMWFVFPQIAGLGHSATATFYAIHDAREAEAYLHHPSLGERLLECTRIVLSVQGKSANEIFGGMDAMKFRSSMTLFKSIAGSESIFQEAIDTYYSGEPDRKTLEILFRDRA